MKNVIPRLVISTALLGAPFAATLVAGVTVKAAAIPVTMSYTDAQAITYTINLDEKTAKTTKYSGPAGADIVIPDTITVGGVAYPVVEVANNSFMESGIRSVVMGNNVLYIGSSAFYNRTNSPYYKASLVSVTLGPNIQVIKSIAFSGNALTSVTIPASVESIATRAFEKNQLTEVTFGGGDTVLTGTVFTDNPLSRLTLAAGTVWSATVLDRVSPLFKELADMPEGGYRQVFVRADGTVYKSWLAPQPTVESGPSEATATSQTSVGSGTLVSDSSSQSLEESGVAGSEMSSQSLVENVVSESSVAVQSTVGSVSEFATSSQSVAENDVSESNVDVQPTVENRVSELSSEDQTAAGSGLSEVQQTSENEAQAGSMPTSERLSESIIFVEVNVPVAEDVRIESGEAADILPNTAGQSDSTLLSECDSRVEVDLAQMAPPEAGASLELKIGLPDSQAIDSPLPEEVSDSTVLLETGSQAVAVSGEDSVPSESDKLLSLETDGLPLGQALDLSAKTDYELLPETGEVRDFYMLPGWIFLATGLYALKARGRRSQ